VGGSDELVKQTSEKFGLANFGIITAKECRKYMNNYEDIPSGTQT
jgi:hypothetical protein